jgi:plasmid stabilization system protein ParE
MAKKLTVQWTEQALDSLEDTLSKIIKKWNYQIAKEFDNEVEKMILRLENNSKLCPPSKKKKIRKCVIHKNTSLVYRIKNSNIELITFVDNRTEHEY